MKNIIKYLESKGIKYTIKGDSILVDLGLKKGYNQTIKIFKLESYNFNNYKTHYDYDPAYCQRQEHKKQKDLINYIDKIINQ
jgi:hypothetical protein